ncbi:Fic family protein [Thermoactinomyces sp. CICC 10521]|uniref:Fic family protein n=1 Tax=Thermoactinomyces daqus TaxID=1329516 RepID=A0A7W2AJC4_9BACL|nr:Fic family protein [Thermoactinomyces daqus]MBH8598429.1 Fic family protein [Thermoactinomyces sp. CICC 10523]MBH8604553.1 Fic family protein [Thermoactinomyces sp. CICC 10522]MBH8609329.1 Fic family protein [Thermoactinomyces sp. CICC 10521]
MYERHSSRNIRNHTRNDGALVQSLVQVHPFYNGNKRAALVYLDT